MISLSLSLSLKRLEIKHKKGGRSSSDFHVLFIYLFIYSFILKKKNKKTYHEGLVLGFVTTVISSPEPVLLENAVRPFSHVTDYQIVVMWSVVYLIVITFLSVVTFMKCGNR